MTDKQVKRAEQMSLDLVTKQQKTPGHVASKSEIIKAIEFVKNEIRNFEESKKLIIEKLVFLQNNETALIEETGKTFNELIVELTGFSKVYFYQLTGNYKFLEEHKRLDLIDKVETGVLTKIKKFKDDPRKVRRLLDEAETLKRDDPRLKSDMSDSEEKGHHTLTTRLYKEFDELSPSQTAHVLKSIVEDVLTRLDTRSRGRVVDELKAILKKFK